MARSRRRTISRQSGDAPRFSYATIAKWGLIALGTSGGTYGVFQVANMLPGGAAAVTDGTEVGPHLAEAASASKPPLPDDTTSGFDDSPRTPPIGMASHTNPAENDSSSTTMAGLPATTRGPASTGMQEPPPPRPAGSQLGPSIPALPNSLNGGNSLDRNLANSLSNAANNGAPPPTSPTAERPGLTNPLAQGPAPTLPSSLPSALPANGASSTSPVADNSSAGGPVGSTNPIASETGTTPIGPPPRLPSNPTSTSDSSLAGGGPSAGPPAGPPPAMMNPPRLINPDANPLASAGSSSSTVGGTNNGAAVPPSLPPGLPPTSIQNPGSVPGSMPTLGATGPNPALLGGAPSSTTGQNPATPIPAQANPAQANPLAPALAASPGSNGGPPTSGLPNGGLGTNGANAPNPGTLPVGPNVNPNPPTTLPSTRPSIGIPQENRLANAPSPSPGVTPSTAPMTGPSSLPRSGSTGLPMADPMVSDPRRTPALPANYPNPSNIAGQTGIPAREGSVAGIGAGRMAAALVSNRPGDPQWEIQQQAALVIEKLSPPAVQVNVPAKFLMVVRNVGRVPAAQVLIRDRVPEKAQLLQATPKPTRQDGDLLEWELPSLAPGDAFQIQLDLLPTEPGEIGSVAQVTSTAVAATRTRSTRPQLTVQHTAPPQAMVGQTVTMNIIVRNDGDGVAENVILREFVPEQLMHPAGNEIENPIGTLAPGQTRTLQLPLVAKTPGTARNTIRVSGDGKLSGEHSIDIQVVAPQLQVSAEGPERRYLSRPATHLFQVKNHGSANATNVQMMARLPQGLRYESSTPEGRYDPSRHAVFWAMANLPSNADQQVSLTTMPMAPGNQPIEFHALADLNQPQVTTKALVVEQMSELFFDIDDLQDPIEIGTNTIYVIRVENQGSQVANNVAVVVDIPEGIEPLNVESPVEYQLQRDGQNSRLVLAPIATMNPRAQLVIRVEARGKREGDHRIEVRMTSAQRPTPVSKQESTQVYGDR